MRNFLIRMVINAVALLVVDWLIGGIAVTTDFGPLLLVALIFGVLNAVIKPIIMVLTCPAVILTLGLFILVINAVILQLTASIAPAGWLTIDGFGSAFFAGIIIAIVNMMLEGALGLKDKKDGEKIKVIRG